MIEVYSDGACEPNSGPRGWAFVGSAGNITVTRGNVTSRDVTPCPVTHPGRKIRDAQNWGSSMFSARRQSSIVEGSIQ
jgi:hypothetical protein